MAKRTEYVVDGGLVTWRNTTDQKAFAKRLTTNVRRATALNALATAKNMRQVIQSGAFKANADLTVALKGSNKPLVAGGDLFQSITVQEINPDEQFVGVLRSDGDINVVEVIHEGAVIPVTPKMRFMFLMLAKASSGEMDPSKLEGRAAELFTAFQGWKPLAQGTTTIVIPERPFIRVTFESPDLIKTCQTNWSLAVQAAMNPKKRETSTPLGKLAKDTQKKLKKTKKTGVKIGKKALKAGKKYGKKALKIGKKSGKSVVKTLRKVGKRVRGAVRGSKKSKGKKK